MQIRVLKDTQAASCALGIFVKEYKRGSTYEIFDELASVFVLNGWGVEFEEFPDEKGIEESPENKAVESSSENKGFFKKIKKRITKS